MKTRRRSRVDDATYRCVYAINCQPLTASPTCLVVFTTCAGVATYCTFHLRIRARITFPSPNYVLYLYVTSFLYSGVYSRPGSSISYV